MTVTEHYTHIAPKLTAYLVANGADYAIACDIVQETFMRIWKMRDDLSEDPDQVSGLAYTIARNIRTDYARKMSRETLQAEIKDGDDSDTPVSTLMVAAPSVSSSDRDYLRARLQRAFAALPPLLREAYTLFQLQELSIREIARRTNATESLVKVRIFRAKEKLRPMLKDLL